MSDPTELSRRERQIMDVVFAQGDATVNQIAAALPDPPTAMAVRRMMHILEEKGFLKRRQEGREVVYSPKQSKQKAGKNALRHVLDTFFGGALDEALAAHLGSGETLSADQLSRINQLIEQARKEGR
ncbi:BlaI/MecI/CopY family transcriptional regulator [Luteolibacter yonseiensis]|uniref:BlaI/MecI/CopY family transcriptional regulator n=1 Tax=Luteolibacter yonseiensis TaxID=1144680 RepID=A0A934R373_9BACT|nr:BlaI/MecI/CopY family transcriptional regulator [Luteolibacter yonseiensis]MBK1814465.1 BlaI/MecI/CopY family transcriptional regulator [Luteolibacter yonseiensis]